MTEVCKDIFGRELQVGDKVAVGMAYGRSSVLRVGVVEKIKETVEHYYRTDHTKWSITVRWTHNGSGQNGGWSPEKSTIKMESGFTYAKLLILPDGFVDPFPEDTART